jgi:general secretion pathway protein N
LILPASQIKKTRMKRVWPLVVLGIASYLLFAIWTLPASVLLRWLPPNVHVDGIHGSAWRGSAAVVEVGSSMLGEAHWKLHPLALFLGHIKADVNLKRLDGFAQGIVTASTTQIKLSDLSASLPLAALPPDVAPGGWMGTVNLRLSNLQIEQGWPTAVAGTIEVLQLTGPARNPTNIGSYKATFPAPKASADAKTLVGALTDVGGPVQINGTLQLKPDRTYLIDGLIAARPDAPRDVSNALQFLGAPDAQGRRPFSLSGSL